MDYIYTLLGKEYIQENKHRNYYQEIVRTMSKSDIMQIILDKKEENKIINKKEYNPELIADYIIDSKILKTNNSLIHKLEFEIRQRDNPNEIKNTKEDLDQKKKIIPIIQLLLSCGVKDADKYKRRNINCPLPDHKDGTPSFHIYEDSNTRKCFGCNKGGTQVDFLMDFYKIQLKEAIDKFLKF